MGNGGSYDRRVNIARLPLNRRSVIVGACKSNLFINVTRHNKRPSPSEQRHHFLCHFRVSWHSLAHRARAAAKTVQPLNKHTAVTERLKSIKC